MIPIYPIFYLLKVDYIQDLQLGPFSVGVGNVSICLRLVGALCARGACGVGCFPLRRTLGWDVWLRGALWVG